MHHHLKPILAALTAAGLSAAIGATASAADLPPAPVYTKAPLTPAYNWTGGYLGIQGGFVRQDGSLQITDLADAGGNLSLNKPGGTVGGVFGYNWQHGSFVYGLESDWSWVGGKPSSNERFLQTSFGTDWIATTRGRAGLAVDATLLYLTGGLAFGHVRNNETQLSGDGTTFISFNQDATKVGWTAGAGIEHMLTANWTTKAEFRYIDLGTSTVPCIDGTGRCNGLKGDFSNTLMMGLVGLNYKF
jgi:outer membrane immunogenic protein